VVRTGWGTIFGNLMNSGFLRTNPREIADHEPSKTPAATPAATAPTPFDYSPWPQFGPAGGPVPNYVNQGLGQWPNFDYWNQIANAFPGMSQYG